MNAAIHSITPREITSQSPASRLDSSPSTDFLPGAQPTLSNTLDGLDPASVLSRRQTDDVAPLPSTGQGSLGYEVSANSGVSAISKSIRAAVDPLKLSGDALVRAMVNELMRSANALGINASVTVGERKSARPAIASRFAFNSTFDPGRLSWLATAASAMRALGPDFQLCAQVHADGSGNLYVPAGFEPTLSPGCWEHFARGLKDHGVLAIEGDLVIEGRPTDDGRTSNTDPSQAAADRALQREGISFSGKLRGGSRPRSAGEIFEHEALPLGSLFQGSAGGVEPAFVERLASESARRSRKADPTMPQEPGAAISRFLTDEVGLRDFAFQSPSGVTGQNRMASHDLFSLLRHLGHDVRASEVTEMESGARLALVNVEGALAFAVLAESPAANRELAHEWLDAVQEVLAPLEPGPGDAEKLNPPMVSKPPDGFRDLERVFGRQGEYVVERMLPLGAGGLQIPVRINERLVPWMQKLLEEAADRDLLQHIHRFGGSFKLRQQRRPDGTPMQQSNGAPSTHGYGISFDINPDASGGSVHPDLVTLFKKYGFVWGGDFKSNPDPMHFQFARNELARSKPWASDAVYPSKTDPYSAFQISLVDRGDEAARTGQRLRHWLKQRHQAFNTPGNLIQFGFEHESHLPGGRVQGRSVGMGLDFRPQEIPDAEWMRLSSADRTASLLETFASTGHWPQMVRTAAAPAFLDERLEPETSSPVTLEAKSAKPASTLLEFFEHVAWAKNRYSPDGRTQYNISFENDPRYAEEITNLVALGSEYATWRMLAGGPLGVSNRNFGVYSEPGLTAIRNELLKATPDLGANFKGSSFAPRSGAKYGSLRRVVLEARAITNNVPDARRLVMGTVRALEDPSNARVRFGRRAVGVRLKDLSGVEHLNPETPNRLPQEVQALFRRALRDLVAGPKTPLNKEVLNGRWSLPMVKWEERPGFSAEGSSQVRAARDRYLNRLQALAAIPDGTNIAGRPMDDRIADAVHLFAKETQLHEYL